MTFFPVKDTVPVRSRNVSLTVIGREAAADGSCIQGGGRRECLEKGNVGHLFYVRKTGKYAQVSYVSSQSGVQGR